MNIVEILIVDDEPTDKVEVKNLLESKGYAVQWCQSWLEVERVLKKRANKGYDPPNVAMIDLHFKRKFCNIGDDRMKEGTRIMKRLPKYCKDLNLSPPPMIAFTNKINNIKRNEVYNAGAIDIIRKDEYLDWERFSTRILRWIRDNTTLRVLKRVERARDKSMDARFIKNALEYTKGNVSKASDILDIDEVEVEKIKNQFSEWQNINA